MHSRVCHSSRPNKSDRPRRMFIAAIAAADAVPLAVNAVPSVHYGMILRGREPGRVRSTAFELELPVLPKGATFFDDQQAAREQHKIEEIVALTASWLRK